MGKMIEVEGFKAFRGSMEIRKKFDEVVLGHRVSNIVTGDWLYIPDRGCWYCRGKSYPENICIIREIWTIREPKNQRSLKLRAGLLKLK